MFLIPTMNYLFLLVEFEVNVLCEIGAVILL